MAEENKGGNASGTNVATQNEGNTKLAEYDYSQYKDSAEKEVDMELLSMPYLNVLDNASKKVEEGMPKGAIYNSVTGVAIEACGEDAKGINFVVCQYQRLYCERVPYLDCKGVNSFVAHHQPGSDFVKAAAKKMPNGKIFGKVPVADGKHELSESVYLYGLILDDAGKNVEGYAVFELSSKNLRPWSKWYTAMVTIQKGVPLFIFRSNIKTALTANKKGKDSYEIRVKPLGADWKDCRLKQSDVEEKAILDSAQQLKKLVDDGKITVNYSAMSDDVSGGDMSDAAKDVADQFDGTGEQPQF